MSSSNKCAVRYCIVLSAVSCCYTTHILRLSLTQQTIHRLPTMNVSDMQQLLCLDVCLQIGRPEDLFKIRWFWLPHSFNQEHALIHTRGIEQIMATRATVCAYFIACKSVSQSVILFWFSAYNIVLFWKNWQSVGGVYCARIYSRNEGNQNLQCVHAFVHVYARVCVHVYVCTEHKRICNELWPWLGPEVSLASYNY